MEQTITQQPSLAGKPSLIGVGELFKRSWQMFKSGFWRLVAFKGVGLAIKLAFILPFIILIVLALFSVGANHLPLPESKDFLQPELLESPFEQTGLPLLIANVSQAAQVLPRFGWFFIVGLVLILALAIVSYWLSAGLLIVVRDLVQPKDVKDSLKQALKQGWRMLWPFAWVGVLQGLAVFGGILLLVVPGIIFAVWFVFSPYVFICEGLKGVAALKRSKALVSGYWWSVFGRMVAIQALALGLALMNYIIPFAGWLAGIFLSLFSAVYYFQLYQNLVQLKKPA